MQIKQVFCLSPQVQAMAKQLKADKSRLFAPVLSFLRDWPLGSGVSRSKILQGLACANFLF